MFCNVTAARPPMEALWLGETTYDAEAEAARPQSAEPGAAQDAAKPQLDCTFEHVDDGHVTENATPWDPAAASVAAPYDRPAAGRSFVKGGASSPARETARQDLLVTDVLSRSALSAATDLGDLGAHNIRGLADRVMPDDPATEPTAIALEHFPQMVAGTGPQTLHRHSKADFAEAWWMLNSDRFQGVGVRPHNIPPAEIETFRGAFFKELPHQQSSRRKRRPRYAPEPDVWVFKGGPKGSSRRNCKMAVVSVSFAHFSRSVLLLAIGANGTGLVERCYGSVTLRTPTPEGTPCIRLSAHRYRIVTETTPSVKMEGSAELWHVLPLAMGGVRAGP